MQHIGHAQLKKRCFRANYAQYEPNFMRKTKMRRPFPENLYFREKTDKSFKASRKYKNQQALQEET